MRARGVRPSALPPTFVKRYLAERLVQFVAVLFVVSVMVFALVRMIPGDPATVQLGSQSTPAALAALRADLDSTGRRWSSTGCGSAICFVETSASPGSAGSRPFADPSLLAGDDPAHASGLRHRARDRLSGRILAARDPRSWLDRAITGLALMGVSLPSFWLGIMLILAVALRTGWFPPSGYAAVWDDPAQALRTTASPP